MNAVARAFPAGLPLAAWWQQLSPFPPRELWVAHLAVHRVEALVRVEHACQPDRLSLRILDTLTRAQTMEALEPHTGLHRQFLHRALTSLRADGLVDAIPSGQWQLSAAGRQGLATGSYRRLVSERQTFHFRAGAAGPRFLPLCQLAGEPCQPSEAWPFDIATLDDCLQRPRDWKEKYGFPEEARARATPDALRQVEWRQVTVVTPLRLTVALAVTDDVRGFVCASEGGTLDTAHPVFTLGSAYELFPELAAVPNAEACAAAWREWCEAQGHPELAAAHRLDLQGHRLLVTPPAAIDQRLQSTADQSWLLIGAGEVRRAARIELPKA